MSVLLTDKLQPRTTGIAITVVGDMDVTGNISVAGTVTYEDVTNVDSLGIITARSGINVSGGQLLVGSNIKLGNASVVTATSFVGSGANLTGVASTDYIITGTAATFNNKVNINSTLTASEGINVTAGVGTFDCDRVRLVRNAGPILELTTNANTADSSIHLSEGSAGSTSNGGAVVYSGAGNRLGICCGTTLTTEKISVLRDSVSVGVGTINPARHLHLHDQSSDTVQLHITNSTTGVSGSDGVSFALGSDESLIINQRESNKILLKTADTDRVSITSGGDLEISGGGGVGSGCSVTWDASAQSMIFKDESKAIFGDGSDLNVYHSSGNNFISGTANLFLQSNGAIALRTVGQDNIMVATAGGSVDMYYNTSKKWETTNDGTVTTGISTATAFVPTSRFTSLGNRRINMNGAMQIWQRSTSAADIGGSNGYFAADRYRSSNNGSARHTISRSTDTPDGFGHSMKIDVTTANSSPSANNYTFFQHRMEGQDLQGFAKGSSNAQQYALSFWVKSAKTGVHVVQLSDVENTRSVSGSYTIASADTWEKHSIIFPADTTGALTPDNDYRMQLYFWLYGGSGYNTGSVGDLATTWGATGTTSRASGQVNVFDNTANNWFITGIQFEIGSVATPFEHRSYGEELSRCQRYFYSILNSGWVARGENGAYVSMGCYFGDAKMSAFLYHPVPMRANPTIVIGTGTNYWGIYRAGAEDTFDSLGSIITSTAAPFGNRFQVLEIQSGVSGTGGHTGVVSAKDTAAYLQFTAEY